MADRIPTLIPKPIGQGTLLFIIQSGQTQFTPIVQIKFLHPFNSEKFPSVHNTLNVQSY